MLLNWTLSLLIFTMIGCSKKTPTTPTKISLIQSLTSLSETFKGGLYLLAYHQGSQKYLVKSLSSNSETFELENGKWDMTVIGWDGPSNPFEGEMNCNQKSDVILNGDDTEVVFNISPQGCATAPISPSAVYRTAQGTPRLS